MKPGPELSVVVPLYNEEANIESFTENLVQALKSAELQYQIVLVDNGSSDKTGKLIASCQKRLQGITGVTVPKNQGYGWGIISGLAAAQGTVIGWIDGDNEIPPQALVSSYQKLREEKLDFCCGQVLPINRSWKRKLMSAMFISFFNLLFQTDYLSINGKPKLFHRESISGVSLKSHDWFIDAELMITMKQLGRHGGFVSFRLNHRQGGVSSVTTSSTLEFLFNLLRVRIWGI